MKAVCPNNPEHKRFSTAAHVMQEWIVDEDGNYISTETECIEITHEPHPENNWVCFECGADAKVTK